VPVRRRRRLGAFVYLFAVLLDQALRFLRQRLGLLDTLPQRSLGLLDLVERLVFLVRHSGYPSSGRWPARHALNICYPGWFRCVTKSDQTIDGRIPSSPPINDVLAGVNVRLRPMNGRAPIDGNGNGRKAPGTKFEVPLCIGEAV